MNLGREGSISIDAMLNFACTTAWVIYSDSNVDRHLMKLHTWFNITVCRHAQTRRDTKVIARHHRVVYSTLAPAESDP